MAIKTLFQRGMRYPRLGVIRLGVKERNAAGREFPKEVEFFVLPPDLQESFEELGLDPRPRAIEVSFPSDDIHAVFQTDFIRYDGPLLAAKCDGETCTLIDKAGTTTTRACGRKPEDAAECSACRAKALGRLNVIVRHGKSMGVYQVLIGGVGRIESLLTELAMYRERPGLSRAWFTLVRIPQQQQIRKQDGARMAREGFPCHLRFDYSPAMILGDMLPAGALVAGQARAALPAAGIDSDADVVGDGAPDDEPEHEAPQKKPHAVFQLEHFEGQPSLGQHVEPVPGATKVLGPQVEKEQPVGPAAPRKDAEHWDVSLCIARAASVLGIQAKDYTDYLDSIYGDHNAMDAMMLGDQQAALEGAARAPKAAMALRKAILIAASKFKQ